MISLHSAAAASQLTGMLAVRGHVCAILQRTLPSMRMICNLHMHGLHCNICNAKTCQLYVQSRV
jgi:hypothetical protein